MGTSKHVRQIATPSGRRAVVDVGSNSVRLVIYEGPARAPIAICNEKSLCGLGRDLSKGGDLNASAVADALSTLVRFKQLLREFGDPPVYAIATAAVREANDGKAFVKSVQKIGFDLKIISGDEEAKLAAYGVISFEPDAAGVVGDMGGGSLELVTIRDGSIGDAISLPVGPFRLMRKADGNIKDARKIIDKELGKAVFLQGQKGASLYAVGGAWRALARIHMRLRAHPLSVLHHYEMTVAEMIGVCDLVSQQSRQSLEEIPGIPRRRLDTLPYAALVMKSVLQKIKARSVIVSAAGVREGLLYRALPKPARKKGPLLTMCKYLASKMAPDSAFGNAAAETLKPIIAQNDPAAARLCMAACLMIDTAAYFHPDLRGRHAFDSILSAPLVGLSHPQRVYIALALRARYEGRIDANLKEAELSLLSTEEKESAIRFGTAMRFVASFAPKSSGLLKGCKLAHEDDRLVFTAPGSLELLMGETPRKRFEAAAAAYGAQAIEIYEA